MGIGIKRATGESFDPSKLFFSISGTSNMTVPKITLAKSDNGFTKLVIKSQSSSYTASYTIYSLKYNSTGTSSRINTYTVQATNYGYSDVFTLPWSDTGCEYIAIVAGNKYGDVYLFK